MMSFKWFFGFVWALCVVLTLTCIHQATAQECVEADGSGSYKGPPGKARELALAMAFSDAVRKGAGVDLISETKVEDFQTVYDQILTSSFGYVESYEVTKHSYDEKSGVYSVQIKAKVRKGRPEMEDVLSLRLLNRRMESPRVVVRSDEKFTGLGLPQGEAPQLGKGALEELSRRSGFEVISDEALSERDSADAARAELLGDAFDAKVKKAGVSSVSDLTIQAKVSGGVGVLRQFAPGVPLRDVAVGIDIKAFWTDTGEIAAAVAIPTVSHSGEKLLAGDTGLAFDVPDQLVRGVILDILKGEKGKRFFGMIISKWVAELDLGAKTALSFKKIDKPAFDRLLEGLRKADGVSYAWPREFDARLFSTIEIESKLPAEQIADAVLKILEGKFIVDRATKRRVAFLPSGT